MNLRRHRGGGEAAHGQPSPRQRRCRVRSASSPNISTAPRSAGVVGGLSPPRVGSEDHFAIDAMNCSRFSWTTLPWPAAERTSRRVCQELVRRVVPDDRGGLLAGASKRISVGFVTCGGLLAGAPKQHHDANHRSEHDHQPQEDDAEPHPDLDGAGSNICQNPHALKLTRRCGRPRFSSGNDCDDCRAACRSWSRLSQDCAWRKRLASARAASGDDIVPPGREALGGTGRPLSAGAELGRAATADSGPPVELCRRPRGVLARSGLQEPGLGPTFSQRRDECRRNWTRSSKQRAA